MISNTMRLVLGLRNTSPMCPWRRGWRSSEFGRFSTVFSGSRRFLHRQEGGRKIRVPDCTSGRLPFSVAVGFVAALGVGAATFYSDVSFAQSRLDGFSSGFDGSRSKLRSGADDGVSNSKQDLVRDVFGPDFISDAAEHAIPALVNISTSQHDSWGRLIQSAGSGFLIREDGLIATNAHVVRHSRSLTVTLYDGRQYRAKVYAADQMSDLALVKIDEPIESTLPIMKIGDSSLLRPGQFVIALGSPLNMSNSVTAGIVSSVVRGANELGIPQGRMDYIQTDAAINSGNSGGPLINLRGEVVGINSMKVAGGDGIGFAIPINTAWLVLSQLIERQKVIRPFLGLRMVALSRNLVKYERRLNRNFPDVESGLLIVNVADRSPAAKAGVKAGDIIVKFDGKPVNEVVDLTRIIGYNIGVSYSMEVMRKGDAKTRSLSIVSEALEY